MNKLGERKMNEQKMNKVVYSKDELQSEILKGYRRKWN